MKNSDPRFDEKEKPVTDYRIEDFIGVFHDVLSDTESSAIIEFYESEMAYNPSHTFSRQESEGVSKLSKDDTTLLIESLTLKAYPFFSFLNKKLFQCYKMYADQYAVLRKFERCKISSGIRIQKTLPGGGYHVWHCEQATMEASSRFGVWSIYLNDVHEGGETEFLYQRKRIPAKRGTVCIFPAAYTHVHRGNPPLSNEKYMITSWLEFCGAADSRY